MSAKQAVWQVGGLTMNVRVCAIQSESCLITTRCQELNMQATRPSFAPNSWRLRAHFQIISDEFVRSVCNMKLATTPIRPRTRKPSCTANRDTGLRTHGGAQWEAGRCLPQTLCDEDNHEEGGAFKTSSSGRKATAAVET